MELEFSRQIFEKMLKCCMKIRPVGANLLHAGGQLGRHDESNIRFS